jgi:hypothetical protein
MRFAMQTFHTQSFIFSGVKERRKILNSMSPGSKAQYETTLGNKAHSPSLGWVIGKPVFGVLSTM